MSLIAKDTGGDAVHFEPIAEGLHLATLQQLIDFGYQPNFFKPEKPAAPQVNMGFEIHDESYEDKDGVTQPRMQFETYLNSTNELSNLRKLLESWIGRAMSDDVVTKGFDLTTMVGRPCQITIVHKPKKSGGKKSVISSIVGWPKSVKAPEPVTERKVFILDDLMTGDAKAKALFEEFPDWMKEKIEGSLERTGHRPTLDGRAPEQEDQQREEHPVDLDIPF